MGSYAVTWTCPALLIGSDLRGVKGDGYERCLVPQCQRHHAYFGHELRKDLASGCGQQSGVFKPDTDCAQSYIQPSSNSRIMIIIQRK